MNFVKLIRCIYYVFLSYFFKFFFPNIIKSISNKKNNVLLLTPFRRDINFDKGIKNSGLGLLFLKTEFTQKMHGIFFLERGKYNFYDYVNKIKKQKMRVYLYGIFINNLMKYLINNYNVEIICNFAIHYKSEMFYDRYATKNRIKFITLHRECLFQTDAVKKFIFNKLKKVKYEGTKLIVHNETAKKIFSSSGFCKKKNIDVVGPLKVDYLKEKSLEYKKIDKSVLIYMFGNSVGISTKKSFGSEWSKKNDIGWNKMIDNLFSNIFENAKKFKKTKFIFKARYKSAEFINFYNQFLKKYNLKNTKLIFEDSDFTYRKKASIIISYGSTAIIESMIFDKSILVPFFNEVHEKKFKEYIPFKEIINTKISCNSVEQFNDKLRSNIMYNRKYCLSKKQNKYLIEKYLGPIQGSNVDKISKIIKNL